MMRALFSGVSGLKVHQTKMDVIGNNISNVNTVGFKASSVTFSDVFYQTTQSATGPNASTGTAGRNAMQIGLGSNVASITTSVNVTGASQRTDNPFDVMIDGDGFFIVNYGGTNYFTKAGSFNIDAQGNLCTPSGAFVMGWQVDPGDPTKTVASEVSPLRIMSPENMYTTPEATTKAYVSGNIDSKDSQVAYNGTGIMVTLNFYDSRGHAYKAELRVRQADDEATNVYAVDVVDSKDETGKSIFVVEEEDTDGSKRYTRSGISQISFGDVTYDVEVDEETGEVTLEAGDSVLLTFNGATGAFVSIGDGSTTGDTNDDELKYVTLTIGATASTGGNPFRPIDIDFSKTTMYSTSGKSSLEATRGGLDGLGAGKKVGYMTGVSIDAAGKIYGRYDNGDSKLLGQIVVATFANPAGLEAVGNNMFRATQNSGDFDGKGKDPTQVGGGLSTGVLEMSNVDLAQQFTEMITTQRGFQANSRIITTSDSLLEELINLKR